MMTKKEHFGIGGGHYYVALSLLEDQCPPRLHHWENQTTLTEQSEHNILLYLR